MVFVHFSIIDTRGASFKIIVNKDEKAQFVLHIAGLSCISKDRTDALEWSV